jgi:hypothetical protein
MVAAGSLFLLSYEITDLFDAPLEILFTVFKHKSF